MARRLVLVNDGDLVVAAGTPEGWGVGVIAGTGSIAVGRTPDGRTARAGGWGHLIGDEGSAYLLRPGRAPPGGPPRRWPRPPTGRDRARPPTRSPIRLCKALGVARASQIVTALYAPDFTRARIASLAPEVLAACDESPEDAARLLPPAGAALAETVAAVARVARLAGRAAPPGRRRQLPALRDGRAPGDDRRPGRPRLSARPDRRPRARPRRRHPRRARPRRRGSLSCTPGVRHGQGRSQEVVLCMRRFDLLPVDWSHPGALGSSPADPRPSLSVSNLESSGLPIENPGPASIANGVEVAISGT